MCWWKNQINYYEECEGSARTHEKSVLTVYSKAQWLGSTERNKKQRKILKNQEKEILSTSLTKKYLKMPLEAIWWECKLNLPKLKKQKKQKWRQKQKLKKIEIEEKGNICLEKGANINKNDLHEKLGHPAEEMVKLIKWMVKLTGN